MKGFSWLCSAQLLLVWPTLSKSGSKRKLSHLSENWSFTLNYIQGRKVDIIFIVGLPGSGKSTLIQNEYAEETVFAVFDDVKGNAVLDCGNFTYSQHYPDIIIEMKDGSKNIVISDISFCEYEKFNQARQILNWWITKYHCDYKMKSVIFKNKPEKCIRNITRGSNRNNQKRIEMVKAFSKNFNPDRIKSTDDDCIIDVYDE